MDYLSDEVRAGLEAARMRDMKRKSRLRIHVGDEVYPILRFWDGGFSLDAQHTPHMRGLVDIYDGARPLYQCLVIATAEEDGELVCEFKRSSIASDTPPLDYYQDENAPVAYLPR